MTKTARKGVSLVCAWLLALSLLGTAPLQALAEEAPADDGTLVYQDVYGVFNGEYALMINRTVHTEVYEGGSYEYVLTSEDIVRSDGTKVIETEQRQYSANSDAPGCDVAKDQWSQYTIGWPHVATETIIQREVATGKEGLFTLDGEQLIPCKYDSLHQIHDTPYVVGTSVEDGKAVCDIYSASNGSLIQSLDCGEADSTSFNYGASFSVVDANVHSQTEEGWLTATAVRSYILKSSDGSFDLIDECVSSKGNMDNYSSDTVMAYLKSNGELWCATADGKKQVCSNVSSTDAYQWNGGIINAQQVDESGQTQTSHYTIDGTHLSWAKGLNIQASASGERFIYSDGENTHIADLEGKAIATLTGGGYSMFGNCIHDPSYKFYAADGTPLTNIMNVTWLGRHYGESGITYTISFNDGSEKYYDADLNEVESPYSQSTGESYTLADGTELRVQWTQSEGERVKTIVDANGNPVVRNGYTIAVSNGSAYHNWNKAQRPGTNIDMFYATDGQGKWGAIDSYGTVLIPFEYEEIFDAGLSDTNLILLKKDGAWYFYDVVEKKITNNKNLPITVTYNQGSQDATGIPAQLTDLKYGSKLQKPADPVAANDDFVFLGWYTSADGGETLSETAYDFNTELTGDLTLYAKWKQEKFTVGITVQDKDGQPVKGATVELVKGRESIESATTDAEGTFTFKRHVPAGIYNVIVTRSINSEKQTKTELVEITDQDVMQGIAMPPEGVSSTLEVGESDENSAIQTPSVVVGNLDKEAEALFGKNGSALKITLTMAVKGASETAAEGAEEIKALKGLSETAFFKYLDISLDAHIVEKSGSEVSTEISETSNVIEIIVEFPFDGRKNVKIHRYHVDGGKGEATTFEEVDGRDNPRDGTCWLDRDNDVIHIFSNKFSTFAISSEAATTYTVTLDANGGKLTGTNTLTTLENGRLAELPTPTREGYTFKGWFTAATGGEQVTANLTVFGENGTLYAQWEKEEAPSAPSGEAEKEPAPTLPDDALSATGDQTGTIAVSIVGVVALAALALWILHRRKTLN